MKKPLLLLSLLCLLALVVLLHGLATGSLGLDRAALWNGLLGRDALVAQVLWELRLPRLLAAFLTGGLLALAGVLMQVLLRNPLADPYVLGISGGAATGALAAMLLGLGGLWFQGAAFGGALGTMLLVFALAHGRGSWTPARLLLTGVVVGAGWGAVIGLLLSLSPDGTLRGMLYWLMGDLSQARPTAWSGAVLLLGLLAGLALARPLNLLAGGELQAAALGVEVKRLRYGIYLLASLLAASAVTLAGSVGFIGLVTPHLVRLMGARDHRLLIPASLLLGGTLLTLADSLSRSLFAPQQLPVGVVTALIGVPLFLYLLRREGARP
jgi:iron complex transport system permease protein